MNTSIRVVVWALLALVVGSMAVPATASAQGTRDAEPVRRAAVAAAPATPEGRLSTELQRALEAGETNFAVLLDSGSSSRARPPSSPRARPSGAAAGNLAVAQPGGDSGFICNNGNCACAGADDCVDMIDAGTCVKDTVGCNAYGCTCEGE